MSTHRSWDQPRRQIKAPILPYSAHGWEGALRHRQPATGPVEPEQVRAEILSAEFLARWLCYRNGFVQPCGAAPREDPCWRVVQLRTLHTRSFGTDVAALFCVHSLPASPTSTQLGLWQVQAASSTKVGSAARRSRAPSFEPKTKIGPSAEPDAHDGAYDSVGGSPRKVRSLAARRHEHQGAQPGDHGMLRWPAPRHDARADQATFRISVCRV